VRESRMFCRLIRKIREPKLPDPTQPLKLRRIDQRPRQLPLVRIGRDAYDVVDRVSVNSFVQLIASQGYPDFDGLGLISQAAAAGRFSVNFWIASMIPNTGHIQ
jgi:hypothetical protein